MRSFDDLDRIFAEEKCALPKAPECCQRLCVWVALPAPQCTWYSLFTRCGVPVTLFRKKRLLSHTQFHQVQVRRSDPLCRPQGSRGERGLPHAVLHAQRGRRGQPGRGHAQAQRQERAAPGYGEQLSSGEQLSTPWCAKQHDTGSASTRSHATRYALQELLKRLPSAAPWLAVPARGSGVGNGISSTVL